MRPTVNKLGKIIKVYTRAWQGLAGPQGETGLTGPSSPYSPVKTITFADSPYSMTTDDSIVFANATDGAIIINLLPSADAIVSTSGIKVGITKIDASANTVTVDGDGSETVSGSLTQTLTDEQDSLSIAPDGSNWHKNG